MIALLTAVLTAAVSMYVAGVLIPHLADGPHGSPTGGLLDVVGMAAVGLAPAGAVVVLLGCAWLRASRWADGRPPAAGPRLAVVTLCLLGATVLAFSLSPVGRALAAWRLD